jgi:hypothetical protein
MVLGGSGVAACDAQGTGSPAASAPAVEGLVSPIDGQVVKLDSEGLTKVRGFTLRTNAGAEIAFTIGVLENGSQFPPSHLAEHMATGTPVRVSFRPESGSAVVYRIEDAPAP